jgi:hypothetical protein
MSTTKPRPTIPLELSDRDSALIAVALDAYAKSGAEGYISARGLARFVRQARGRKGWRDAEEAIR